MNSSLHIDNKGKDNLILGKRWTQGLDGITFTEEAKYPINFTQPNKKFCQVCILMGTNVFYLLILQKYYFTFINIKNQD